MTSRRRSANLFTTLSRTEHTRRNSRAVEDIRRLVKREAIETLLAEMKNNQSFQFGVDNRQRIGGRWLEKGDNLIVNKENNLFTLFGQLGSMRFVGRAELATAVNLSTAVNFVVRSIS